VSGRWRSRAATALLLGPTSAWYFLLLLAPLIILVAFSFGARAPEGGYAPALQLDNYLELPTRITAFTNTLWMAVGGTLLCLIVGYPLAYYLATRAGRKRTLLVVLVVVPFWTSFLIRTYAWVTILGNNGIPALLKASGAVIVLSSAGRPAGSSTTTCRRWSFRCIGPAADKGSSNPRTLPDTGDVRQ
jgi:spermidine/putrescine transport system permease protein